MSIVKYFAIFGSSTRSLPVPSVLIRALYLLALTNSPTLTCSFFGAGVLRKLTSACGTGLPSGPTSCSSNVRGLAASEVLAASAAIPTELKFEYVRVRTSGARAMYSRPQSFGPNTCQFIGHSFHNASTAEQQVRRIDDYSF